MNYEHSGIKNTKTHRILDVYNLSELCKKTLRAFRLKYVITLFAAVVFISPNSFAQLDTAIVRTYGGPYYEEGRQIIECSAGGYAVIGTTGSDQPNNTNFYLLRLDEELNCIWNKNYGGAEVEWGYSIVEDANGNFLICGYTNSFGEGGYDILVYKVDTEGSVIWEKTYGGSDWDFAYKIIAHPTEGYLICGKTYSYGNGGSDAYLLHINDDGNLINEWTYGGEGDDEYRDIEAIDSYSIVTCGTVTLQDSTKSIVSRTDIEDWTLIWEKVIYESHLTHATGLSVSNERIFVCGNRQLQNTSFGYTISYDLEGNELGFSSEDLNTSTYYYDIVNSEDNIYTAGKIYVEGFGSHDIVSYQLNDVGFFLQGFVYGDQGEDQFNSLLKIGSSLVFVGSYQEFDSGNIQLISMIYSKTSMNNNIMEPDEQNCLTVGIDYQPIVGTQLIKKEYFVIDISGRILIEPTKAFFKEIIPMTESGLNIIRSTDGAETYKVFKP